MHQLLRILEVVTAVCSEVCFTNTLCYFNLTVKEYGDRHIFYIS